MEDKLKVSALGLRIGYLYDLAIPEDKAAIEQVLNKYGEEYPLILVGKKMELAAAPKEAKHFRSFFDGYKK